MTIKNSIILGLALISGWATANAVPMTINFSGADIMAYATTANTTATPMIGDGKIDFTNGTAIRTYTTASASPDLSGFNAWIDSLTSQQGVRAFNLWLQDGASNQAAMWGETLALTDPFSANITAFASTGWTAEIVTCPASWGSYWAGRHLIQYYTDNPAYYLRNGSTAQFGFSADLSGINNAMGPTYQIWVGGSEIIASTDVSMLQRAIGGTNVPDSSSILTILLGLATIFVFGRRKAKA